MELKRVVVTGIGGFTPIGNSLEEIFHNLTAGTSGSGPITRFNAEMCKTRFACEVKDFDPSLYLDKKEIRKMDLYEQYAMAASVEWIKDSFIEMENINKDKFGVIWGTGIGGIGSYEPEIREYYEAGGGTPHFSPYTIPKLL